MSLDIKPLSITAMFNNIKSFFQSQENNSKWRDLSSGAEGIFFIRMIANVLSVLSSRIMTGRREQFHDTANFMSSQIGLAVNNGYSVFRGRNHRRKIRIKLDSKINRTIPALSVVGFFNQDYSIITLEEINPSKNDLEDDKFVEFEATIGALKEITWQARTAGLKKFVRHEQGISEDYQLFMDGKLLPTTKIAKEKVNDKYYVYTNPYKSVTIEYLNNLPTFEHKYNNDSVFTLRYVELANMDMDELTSDMFTIGTLESSVILTSYKDFEDIESIKQNSPVYRENQNLIRSKEDWKDAYRNALPVVKEITYRAITPTYTQLCCLKNDQTLMECTYNSSLTMIDDVEENSIHDILEPARYFGRPFPDMEDPKREITTLDITLGLVTTYKNEEDILAEVQGIIDRRYTDKFNQVVNIYDIEEELKTLSYVKYARVSLHIPKRENFASYRKGDMMYESFSYDGSNSVDKYYRCKDILGMTSEVEPIWNVPGSSTEVETGYITVDNELIWQCYKKLANMEDLLTPWNKNAFFTTGDFVYSETYPRFAFKCISLIKQNDSVAPDVVNVEVGDYIEDGNLILLCIPYNSDNYPERTSRTKYKLRDRMNINGLSFEVVGFKGDTSGSTSIKVRSQSQPLYTIPMDARQDILPGNLYLADIDYRTYVKQGDMIQVSALMTKNTPYEEIIEDGLTLNTVSSAVVKEYEDEDTSNNGANGNGAGNGGTGDDDVVVEIPEFNVSIPPYYSTYGLSSRTTPSVSNELKVDDEVNDFQLHLICIPYDSKLQNRLNFRRYKVLDKFNINGITSVSFEVMYLQNAGLSAEADPYILNKRIGDTVEDYQLEETIIEYDASFPMRTNFTEYAVGDCFNVADIFDKSLQVTGLTDAGVDFSDSMNSNQGSTGSSGSSSGSTGTTTPGTDPEQPKEDEETETPEVEEQNANWKALEKIKEKMEYVQSWITSEANDNLRNPADVLAFYMSLGDGSRFTPEEIEELVTYYQGYKPEDEAQIYLHMDQFGSDRVTAIEELVATEQLPKKPLIDINCVKYYKDDELVYIDRYGSAQRAEDGALIFNEEYTPLTNEYAIRREDANGNLIKIISITTDSLGNYVVEETYNKTFTTTVTNVTYQPYPNIFINRFLTCIETTTPIDYYMDGSTINFAYNTVLDGDILWEEMVDLETVEYDWNVFPKVLVNVSLK